MKKCPYCKEEISYLEVTEYKRGLRYKPNGWIEDLNDLYSTFSFRCPECENELAEDEEEVIYFFNKEQKKFIVNLDEVPEEVEAETLEEAREKVIRDIDIQPKENIIEEE